MAFSYQIQSPRRLLLARPTGPVDAVSFVRAREAVLADDRYQSDFDQLWDLRGIAGLRIDRDAVRDLAHLSEPASGKRWAIVADQPAVYGAARMFAALRSAFAADEELRVFRTLEDARGWLASERR
ncbi:MAG: hypothetical protein HKP30_15055 [Myxococcales bacterium]|nr:hypothetical protein [Myxococcales bacterium]